MPKRNDIETVLVIGSGPIVIGQACEFDYSGTQACKVLSKKAIAWCWSAEPGSHRGRSRHGRPHLCPGPSRRVRRAGHRLRASESRLPTLGRAEPD